MLAKKHFKKVVTEWNGMNAKNERQEKWTVDDRTTPTVYYFLMHE